MTNPDDKKYPEMVTMSYVDYQSIFNELKEAKSLLAKVCVLEVGAIGEIGDLYYDKFAMIAFRLDRKLIAKWNDRPEGKIIQRNNRPVIYKESAVVADNNQTIKGK